MAVRRKIPTPSFLKKIQPKDLVRRGRVHMKHVFNPMELDEKARDHVLYKLVTRKGAQRPVRLTAEQVEQWHYGIKPWSETMNPLTRRMEYTPTKKPFTVYEFREGKLRPLRSNHYSFEVGLRRFGLNQRVTQSLGQLILEKGREARKLILRKPKTGKKTTRATELIRHNEKLHEMYLRMVEVQKLRLFRMDEMKAFINAYPALPEGERANKIAEIDTAIQKLTRAKEVLEREAFLAEQRIDYLHHFPGAPKKDREQIVARVNEMITAQKKRAEIFAECADYSTVMGELSHALQIQQAKAEVEYYQCYTTAMTEYIKAAHRYGTTLSKIEVDEIEDMHTESKRKLTRWKKKWYELTA